MQHGVMDFRQMRMSADCYFVRLGPAVQPVVRLEPAGAGKVRVIARDGLIVGRSYILADTDGLDIKRGPHLVEKPAGLPECAESGWYVVRLIEIDGRLDRSVVNQGRLLDPSYLESDIGLWLASCEGTDLQSVISR